MTLADFRVWFDRHEDPFAPTKTRGNLAETADFSNDPAP